MTRDRVHTVCDISDSYKFCRSGSFTSSSLITLDSKKILQQARKKSNNNNELECEKSEMNLG